METMIPSKVFDEKDIKIESISVENSLSISQNIPSDTCRIRNLVNQCTEFDHYNNCIIDFSKFSNFTNPSDLKYIKNILPSLIKEQKDRHVFCLKLLHSQARVVKYAIQNGFKFHNANSDNIYLTHCLKGHTISDCKFPKFMTASIGVTAVVFDKSLENVLLIQEKYCQHKKLKPPTGTVDYLEYNESPLKAVVRELKEETNVDVNILDAVLVGNTWTQQLRGLSPDINFIFAFKASSKSELLAEEGEVDYVAWHPVKEYLEESSEELSRPWAMKRMVRAAYLALKHQKDWGYQNLHWNNGKPVTLYSFNPEIDELMQAKL